MRRSVLLLLLATAWSQEDGRRPVIPPDDPFPWCGTDRVWTGPLRVRLVRKPGGAPVPGVAVALETGAVRTTDADGVARFERADSTDTLHVRAVGFRPYEAYVPEDEEEHVAELVPGVPLRGRVRLADGSPAAGAHVACWDERGVRLLDDAQVVDAEGRFTIPAVERAKPVRLVVWREGSAPAEIRRGFVREEPEMVLVLGGGGVVEGVVDPPGEVWVREAHRSNPLRLCGWQKSDRERIGMETAGSRSDPAGRYRIDGLAVPGAYVVCTGARESAIVELDAERPRARVDLSGAAGPLRRCRVLDESLKPLAERWIVLAGPTRREVAATSAEGVADLPPGDWRVEVDGYLSAPASPEVRLDRGITLRGVVTGSGGAPAPGAWVAVTQAHAGGRYSSRCAQADEHGRFAISGLVEGDAWLTDGREPEGPEDGRIRVRAGLEGVRVALPPAARIVGRLSPAPATVDPRGPFGSVAALVPDGSFRVEGLPAGRAFVLELSFDEGRTCLEIPCDPLEPAGVRDLGTLRTDTTATVAGVVEDADGRPVDGARVQVAVGGPYEPTYTDERGRFSLAVRPVAPVVLEAAAPGFAAQYVAVAEPATAPIRIVLDPGGLVRGRVVGAHGRAVPGAYVVFWRRLGSGQLSPYDDWKPDVDSAGRFEVRLPPGTFHVRFYDVAFSHARVPGPDVTVRGGEAQDLEVRLP